MSQRHFGIRLLTDPPLILTSTATHMGFTTGPDPPETVWKYWEAANCQTGGMLTNVKFSMFKSHTALCGHRKFILFEETFTFIFPWHWTVIMLTSICMYSQGQWSQAPFWGLRSTCSVRFFPVSTQSDGTEPWAVHHARDGPGAGLSDGTTRAEKIRWNPDRSPGLPRPSGLWNDIPIPSGEWPNCFQTCYTCPKWWTSYLRAAVLTSARNERHWSSHTREKLQSECK